ncbi:DUF5710 domain-containing protein [Zoogloea sp. LCSB751]|uniref:DUF5710 domain-containing protein n=1 Tax=Zoogloea sp. LCSB751 TaxID=1965277 RepID=UPI0009A51104|nr:DUF5710 domain-containing protein [Zoogloea sp. LCSB751]
MRTNLKVPFAEKDEAKRLGARWDPARRVWYVLNVTDLSAFARWHPSAGTEAAAPVSGGTSGGQSKPVTAASLVKVGALYFELSCDCLPWEGCAKCQAIIVATDWRNDGARAG